MLLVVERCWVLYSSGFLCVSSHYLILPRVSFLGLGVRAPTPKAQVLISGQEQRFHKWFVMALHEIKTNTPKWETKDELQTNGSYKIRQIIIKIMECQFSSLSCIQLFVTPWTAACQTSLSITNSQSLLKLMFIELVMPSNHLILCDPHVLLPSIFPSIRVFSNESTNIFRGKERKKE